MNTTILAREQIVNEVRVIRQELITVEWTFTSFLDFLQQGENNRHYVIQDETLIDFLYDHYEMITENEVERLATEEMEMYDYILELDLYLVEFCKLLY